MQLTIKQLFDLCTTQKLAVLGHDGLPFTSVINSDRYYFLHDEEVVEPFDFEEFFLKCVHTMCWDQMIAGECEVHQRGDIKWIGVTIYNKQLEAIYDLPELLKMATKRGEPTPYTRRQQEFVELTYQKDGCPEVEARCENWDSMVKSFYDGNSDVALEEFSLWLKKRDTDRRLIPK